MRLDTTLALLLHLPLGIWSMYDSESPVVQLTGDNFNKQVLKSNKVTLVEFYAPWCGHCKSLKPIYESVATKLKDLAQIAAIDCDADKNKAICGQYDIKGFPTIKLFPSSVKLNGKKKVPTDYNGARTKKDISDFVINAIPNKVKRITTGKLTSKVTIKPDDFLATESKDGAFIPKAILFTEKKGTTPLYKAVAVEFNGRMNFGEVRKEEKELVEKYNIKKFPTLLVIKSKESSEPIVFDGELNAKSLKEFIQEHALPSKKNSENSNSKKKEKKSKESNSKEKKKKDEKEEDEEEPKAKPSIEPFDPSVIEISEQNEFEKECLDNEGICVLNFFKDEHKNELSEALKTIKKNLYDLKTKNDIPSSTPVLNFLYSIPNENTFLFKQFEIPDTASTVTLILQPKRKLYAFKTFDTQDYQSNVQEYISESLKGKVKFYHYTFVPKIKKVKKGKKKAVKEEKDEL